MRLVLAGLAGFSLTVAATGALAQAAAPAAKPTVDGTTVGDLMANPTTNAVLQKDVPELLADPRIEQAKGMTLKEIEPYSEGKIDDAALAKIQKDLDAATGK